MAKASGGPDYKRNLSLIPESASSANEQVIFVVVGEDAWKFVDNIVQEANLKFPTLCTGETAQSKRFSNAWSSPPSDPEEEILSRDSSRISTLSGMSSGLEKSASAVSFATLEKSPSTVSGLSNEGCEASFARAASLKMAPCASRASNLPPEELPVVEEFPYTCKFWLDGMRELEPCNEEPWNTRASGNSIESATSEASEMSSSIVSVPLKKDFNMMRKPSIAEDSADRLRKEIEADLEEMDKMSLQMSPAAGKACSPSNATPSRVSFARGLGEASRGLELEAVYPSDGSRSSPKALGMTMSGHYDVTPSASSAISSRRSSSSFCYGSSEGSEAVTSFPKTVSAMKGDKQKTSERKSVSIKAVSEFLGGDDSGSKSRRSSTSTRSSASVEPVKESSGDAATDTIKEIGRKAKEGVVAVGRRLSRTFSTKEYTRSGSADSSESENAFQSESQRTVVSARYFPVESFSEEAPICKTLKQYKESVFVFLVDERGKSSSSDIMSNLRFRKGEMQRWIKAAMKHHNVSGAPALLCLLLMHSPHCTNSNLRPLSLDLTMPDDVVVGQADTMKANNGSFSPTQDADLPNTPNSDKTDDFTPFVEDLRTITKASESDRLQYFCNFDDAEAMLKFTVRLSNTIISRRKEDPVCNVSASQQFLINYDKDLKSWSNRCRRCTCVVT